MAKRLLIVLESDLHTSFKALCKEAGISMHQAVVDAVTWMTREQAVVDLNLEADAPVAVPLAPAEIPAQNPPSAIGE